MRLGRLSARFDHTNVRHHLWLNNGTWWVHYTLHWGFRKRRIRRSLRTSCLEVAIARRDELFDRIAGEGEEVGDRPRGSQGQDDDEVTDTPADTTLSLVAYQIPGCEEKFTLLFSDQSFPGHQSHARWLHPEGNGNWYEFVESGVKGWLCPALLKYFDEAPKDISIEIRRR